MERIDLAAPHPHDPEEGRSGGAPEYEALPRSGWADFQQNRMRFLAARSRESAGSPPPVQPAGRADDGA